MKMLVAALAAFVVAGGIAYAAIPDSDGTYHACMLKGIGTIRIIDPAKQQRCTSLESEITFNQRGPAGASPTVAQLDSGDAHCATGGAAITDANGTTAYVCNGAAGHDGQSFSGTFTSPNGAYTLSVTDSGVAISGAGMSAHFNGNGVDVTSPGSLDVTVGASTQLAFGASVAATVGGSLDVAVSGGLSTASGNATTLSSGKGFLIDADQNLQLHTDQSFNLNGGGTGTVQAAGTLFLRGATIQEN